MNLWKAAAAVMLLVVLAPDPAFAHHPKVKTICEPGWHLGPDGHQCVADGSSSGGGLIRICKPGYHLSPSGKHCRRDH